MTKITSLDDLRRMRASLEQNMNIREKSTSPETLTQIKVGMATCGLAAGARAVMEALIAVADELKVPAVVTQTGCMGYCYAEPTVEVIRPGSDPVVFGHVDAARARQIVERYVQTGELLDGIIPVNYQTIKDK
ncbi:MAG: (2Fe-2S) ferredoxin domain-containing protein [Rikenellaceae bacterium]|jgi:NADP-reducing hydrogenase subunit HndB|nr:(2Fe-2S) ferredoxin domain-containing protein [Rikenellaceae bacterium]